MKAGSQKHHRLGAPSCPKVKSRSILFIFLGDGVLSTRVFTWPRRHCCCCCCCCEMCYFNHGTTCLTSRLTDQSPNSLPRVLELVFSIYLVSPQRWICQRSGSGEGAARQRVAIKVGEASGDICVPLLERLSHSSSSPQEPTKRPQGTTKLSQVTVDASEMQLDTKQPQEPYHWMSIVLQQPRICEKLTSKQPHWWLFGSIRLEKSHNIGGIFAHGHWWHLKSLITARVCCVAGEHQ